MNELIQILIGNTDLPVLASLLIFSIIRINAIDRKVSAVRARLDTLEQLVLTRKIELTNGNDKRPKTKVSKRKKRQR